MALPYCTVLTCTQKPHLVLNSRFPFSSSTIALLYIFPLLTSCVPPLPPLLLFAPLSFVLFCSIYGSHNKGRSHPSSVFCHWYCSTGDSALETAFFLITTKTKSQLLLLTALLHGLALFSPCHCDSGFSAVLDCIHSTAIPSVLLQVDFQPVREPASALSWHWHHQHQPRNPEETIVQ